MGVISYIKEEIKVVKERDPAIKSDIEVFLYPSFKVMLHYRIAHKLYLKKHYFLARWVSQRGVRKTGIEIHPGAKLGHGILIDHGCGVVIGETAEVGDNCTIYQGVTLGGVGLNKGKRHPTLGNNVTVGAGAKILGAFEVGDNCKIAANAVLLKPLENDTTAVGVPARPVKVGGVPVRETENHVSVETYNRMEERVIELEQELRRLQAELEASHEQ